MRGRSGWIAVYGRIGDSRVDGTSGVDGDQRDEGCGAVFRASGGREFERDPKGLRDVRRVGQFEAYDFRIGTRLQPGDARGDVRLDDIAFDVIGRADLITNKKASGRPKDFADVAALESTNED